MTDKLLQTQLVDKLGLRPSIIKYFNTQLALLACEHNGIDDQRHEI